MFGRVSLLLLTLLVAGCDRPQPLPELGSIGAFQLQDQSGRTVSEATLRGKVWAAAFMFTRCPMICPRITREMRKLQQSTKEKQLPLHFVSFSVDPENDTSAVLQKYGEKYGVDFSTWSFLTGDYAAVKRTSVEGFKLALDGKADPAQDHFGIMHGSHLVLVDGQGKIRGYYRTSEQATLQQLLADSQRLIAEARR